MYRIRAVASGGLGKPPPPAVFGQIVNPISTRGGADYAHHSTTSPPGFSDLATALLLTVGLTTATKREGNLPFLTMIFHVSKGDFSFCGYFHLLLLLFKYMLMKSRFLLHSAHKFF